MIRSQRYLDTALAHVEAVRDATAPGDERRQIYGGLCHSFPVLVRTNGLCQALAFVAAKAAAAGNDVPARAWAYRQLRTHVREVLGLSSDPLQAARTADLTDYLRYTRTILDAWVYYRRFAVSVLEVEAASGEETAP
jgi:CRISPR-associated protein Cmr5